MGRFPPALESDASLYAHPDTVAQLRAATRIIPADAPVDADDGLTVWLANRHTINDFPDRLSDDDYVVIDRIAYLSGPTSPTTRLRYLATLPSSGRRVLYLISDQDAVDIERCLTELLYIIHPIRHEPTSRDENSERVNGG